MPFVESTAPDISFGIPFEIGTAATSAYAAATGTWDVSIGGLGFNLRPTAQAPYMRATESIKRQQIDTSTEPGEQALSSWWIRSQADWTSGAGATWYEPGVDEWSVARFDTSHGVDVWTRGQFSLLHKLNAVGSAAADPVYLSAATVSGVAGYVKATGTTAVWHPASGSTNSKTLGGSGASQPAVAGRKVYVGHSAGVDTIDYTADTIANTWTAASACRVWYVKDRLIVAIGNVLYSVAPSTAGAVTSVGTAIYTHPSTSWTWTDVAECGSAIIASGYVDSYSSVIQFTIENNGSGVPVMVGGSQVALMPPGEQITCMGVYLGSVIVLGTSRGVRVGEVSSEGEIAYGPLTVETSSSVLDVAFRDRFAYCTVTAGLANGGSGAVRIDLSVQADEAGRRAWAYDVVAPTSATATSITLQGEQVVLAANQTVYLQSATEYESSGYLTMGKVRYRTVEPKAFRLARLEVDIPAGTAAVTALTPSGAETRIIEYTTAFSVDTDVAVQIPNEYVHQWLQFKVSLTSASDQTPVVTGFSAKAVPAPGRVRLYQFPLSCFDHEKDRYGTTIANEVGGAYARLAALEAVEETAVPVRVIDNRVSESFIGIIDSVDFSALHAPDRSAANFGGVAVVTVRRL